MSDVPKSEQSIFLGALEIGLPEDRAKYLDAQCSGDATLRAEVEALLDADEKSGDLLDAGAAACVATIDQSSVEQTGQMIGRYKLRERLGEGGFGVVWAAEQLQPVCRKVALKIIKPGMDTESVVARFEAERQALALMDHPNIAHILDGGTTETGRPYFVMELIRGLPITDYCDRNKLAVPQRLELLVDVCRAVQHAHQKGIIHRDIKPSNVLVTLHDGVPVVKIIDFGIAKALNQKLTDKTVYTRVHQAIGTLAYMSPEQAELSGLDIDTRADVYGLGVLLYELLTGTTPFGKKRLEEAALHEACRIIREEEPPKASTRLSTLGEAATAVSAQRSIDPRDLARLVRGDLDWILLRTLEKDRTRRYESASALAADIQRCLNDDPIEARPPSTTYKLRKFVRRNKGPVAASIAVVAVMVAGIVGTSVGLVRERSSAIRLEVAVAELKETLAELQDELIERAILCAFADDRSGTKEVIAKAKRAGVSDAKLSLINGVACFFRGDNADAVLFFKKARDEDPSDVSALAMLAVASAHDGDYATFATLMSKLQSQEQGNEYEEYESLLVGYAYITVDSEKAERILQEVVEKRPSWAFARSLLGAALANIAWYSGDPEYINRALDESDLADRLLGQNRFVMMGRLWIHTVAIRSTAPQTGVAESLRKTADKIAISLGQHPDYVLGNVVRAFYYDEIGDTAATDNAWKDAIREKADCGCWASLYAAFLYENGRKKEALRIVDIPEAQTPEILMARAYLLAEIPERREEARKLYEQLVAEHTSWFVREGAVQILLLLGDPDRARNECIRFLDAPPADGIDSMQLASRECVEFVAGKTLATQFLERGGPSLLGRCNVNYQLALKSLANGDRGEPIDYFSECVSTGQFCTINYGWAKAFRAQMRRDSSWPDWIQEREERE